MFYKKITTFSKEYNRFVIDNSKLSKEDEVGYIDTQESIFVGGAIDEIAFIENTIDKLLQDFNVNVLFYILHLVKNDYEARAVKVVDLESKGLLLHSTREDLMKAKKLVTDIENLIIYTAGERALSTDKNGITVYSRYKDRAIKITNRETWVTDMNKDEIHEHNI